MFFRNSVLEYILKQSNWSFDKLDRQCAHKLLAHCQWMLDMPTIILPSLKEGRSGFA